METVKPTLYSARLRSHSGWSETEDAQLFSEVKHARESGKPLRTAFDRIAQLTGRKSNSIRNYYYLRIRDEDICRLYEPCKTVNFVPFEEDEVRTLLRKILTDRAKGISVRASTMALGDGDTTAMLRYQNKYRSVVRSNPELVRSVISELKSEGIPVFDPYTDKNERRLGRPCKSAHRNEQLVDIMAETVSELYNVEGLDVSALFESIGALALSAGRGATAIRRLNELESMTDEDVLRLRDENTELHSKLSEQNLELTEHKSRLLSLTAAFRKLVRINTEFLEMSGVSKVSYLGNYIRELSDALGDGTWMQ